MGSVHTRKLNNVIKVMMWEQNILKLVLGGGLRFSTTRENVLIL